MAKQIDLAVFWLITTLSAFFLSLSLSDGRLLFAIPSAFALVLLLRLLICRLPEKHRIQKKERIRRIHRLFFRWTIIDKKQALCEIQSLLPDLYEESVWPTVQLIQHPYDCEAMHSDRLLDIWRNSRRCDSLHLLITGNVHSDVISLLPELSAPSVHLIDAEQLKRRLIPLIHTLPMEPSKKEQRKPLSVRAAQFIRSFQPIRASLYTIVSLILYLLTHSAIYLVSSLMFLAQLLLYFAFRITADHKLS